MSAYLIIGQGLAGTLIGYRLEKAGKEVHYLNAPDQTAASSVAAGVINPLTGRRFVKSWRIEELIPVAKALYSELEAELGVKLWHDLPLIRTLHAVANANDWSLRATDPAYREYVRDRFDTGRIPEVTQPVHGYAGINGTARVDIGLLIHQFRKKLEEENRITIEQVDYGAISVEDFPRYRHQRYAAIIFCEGWRARDNPYFDYLPHRGTKGEVLIIRTAAPPLRRMFKNRVFLVPQADGTYWVGATNQNHFENDGISKEGRRRLLGLLDEVLTVPYEVVEQRAAVRPTVKDRRPFLGEHSTAKGLYIFNGLGTKGTSLAPLCSLWLRDLILEGRPVPAEVDIHRHAE